MDVALSAPLKKTWGLGYFELSQHQLGSRQICINPRWMRLKKVPICTFSQSYMGRAFANPMICYLFFMAANTSVLLLQIANLNLYKEHGISRALPYIVRCTRACQFLRA